MRDLKHTFPLDRAQLLDTRQTTHGPVQVTRIQSVAASTFHVEKA